MVLYICVRFHETIWNGFQLTKRTLVHGGNDYVQRSKGNNSKSKQNRVSVHVLDWSVSSSSWCLGRAAVCDCDTPWTFLLPFLHVVSWCFTFVCSWNITNGIRVMERTRVHGRNDYVKYSKGNNSKRRQPNITVHVLCTLSYVDLHWCEVSWKYLKRFQCNGADTKRWQTGGRTDAHNFGRYNIIRRHFLWRGIKSPYSMRKWEYSHHPVHAQGLFRAFAIYTFYSIQWFWQWIVKVLIWLRMSLRYIFAFRGSYNTYATKM